MGKMKKVTIITSLALAGLFLSLAYLSPTMTARATWTYPSGFDPHGGYIDRWTWVVYPSEDYAQAILALQSGIVDAYDERVYSTSVPDLEAIPGVSVTSELGIIYRQFTLNCQRFPTNVTGYRVAMAYALDKIAVCESSTGGYAQPMDGAIPIPITRWTYEDQITSHFYSQDIASANASLDAALFRDLDGDGWREFDTNNNSVWDAGVDIDDGGAIYNPANPGCHIELMASAGYDPAIQAVLHMISGMALCGLRGSMIEVNFDALIDALESGEFNLGCFSWNIEPPGEPDLLYDYFQSESGTNLFFYRYNNSEYDYHVEAMMNASTYLEAREWAWNCSEILLRDMPMVTCYNDVYINGYRTDRWTGYVNVRGLNRMGNNPWTHVSIRLNEAAGGPFGCYPTEYRSVLSEGMDTTNILLSDSGYTDQVCDMIYDSLWEIDPDTWDKSPLIAWNWTIEETTASGDILDGQKFTFYLFENITWHDGTPLTSEDVAYSFETIWQYSPYEEGEYVENIYRIDTPDDYTVEIYTDVKGYFEFSRATNNYILPKHIWEPHFNFTNWVPSTVEEMTGSGPYKWNSRIPGQYVVLDRNENWHFGITHPDRIPCGIGGNPILYVGIGIAVVVIIIIAGIYFFRIRGK